MVAIRKSPELVLVERGTASSRNYTKDNRPEVFANNSSGLTTHFIVTRFIFLTQNKVT